MPPHPSEPVAAKPTALTPGGQETDRNAGGKRPAVLHIEDDSLWARVVAGLLGDWPEVCPVGAAGNGHDGLVLCAERKPAVVILDLVLPDLKGFEVLDRLNALPHPPQILLLTCRQDEAVLYRLGFGGVAGLIWKSIDFARHLRPALAALAAGRSYFPPEVTGALRRFHASPDAFFKILSPLEQRLVSLAGMGWTDGEIARRLACGFSTVRVHFRNIMIKLGLEGRHALLRWARTAGFDHEPPPGKDHVKRKF